MLGNFKEGGRKEAKLRQTNRLGSLCNRAKSGRSGINEGEEKKIYPLPYKKLMLFRKRKANKYKSKKSVSPGLPRKLISFPYFLSTDRSEENKPGVAFPPQVGGHFPTPPHNGST